MLQNTKKLRARKLEPGPSPMTGTNMHITRLTTICPPTRTEATGNVEEQQLRDLAARDISNAGKLNFPPDALLAITSLKDTMSLSQEYVPGRSCLPASVALTRPPFRPRQIFQDAKSLRGVHIQRRRAPETAREAHGHRSNVHSCRARRGHVRRSSAVTYAVGAPLIASKRLCRRYQTS